MRLNVLGIAGLATVVLGMAMETATAADLAISAREARAIAKEATIYGFPLVDNYRIQYSYCRR